MNRLAAFFPHPVQVRWARWRMDRMRVCTIRPGERRLSDEEQGLLALAEFAWRDEDGARRLADAERCAEQEAAVAARGDDWWRG